MQSLIYVYVDLCNHLRMIVHDDSSKNENAHIAKGNLFSYKITIIKLYYDKVDQFSEYQNSFSNEFIKPFCNEDRAHCVHQIIVT